MNEDTISSMAGDENVRTAKQYASQLRDQAQHAAEQVRDQAGHVAEQVRDHAGQVAGQVREQAQRAFTQGDQYVHQNPWPVVLGAVGLGLLVGYSLAQRHEPSLRERYLEEPLDHARDVLAALLSPLASRVHKEYGHARSAIEEAADSLKDIDPAKQASRAARKLRFW